MTRVAIIGAGRIAQGFDEPRGQTLTHVKAYLEHGDFEVVAFCDTDLARARVAAERWKIPHAVSDPDALRALRPDVISVCTPDETHLFLLERCLDLGPRLVFCEKPLATNAGPAQAVVDSYERKGVALAVNYTRRYMAVSETWRKLILAGDTGKIRSVRARYYGGWFHNASHLVDLLQYLLEPSVQGGCLIRQERRSAADLRLTGSAVMRSGATVFPFHFECLGDDRVAHFEVEILFDDLALWMGERDGTRHKISRIRENRFYPGYFEQEDTSAGSIDPSEAITRAVQDIQASLLRAAPLPSTGRSALATLELCESIAGLPVALDGSLWRDS